MSHTKGNFVAGVTVEAVVADLCQLSIFYKDPSQLWRDGTRPGGFASGFGNQVGPVRRPLERASLSDKRSKATLGLTLCRLGLNNKSVPVKGLLSGSRPDMCSEERIDTAC